MIIFIHAAAGFMNCADIAPSINPVPKAELSPPENLGTLYPGIQSVYPGTLQTLDIPQSYPTNVDTSAADIIAVFSHEMENRNGLMSLSFSLYENLSDTPTPISVSPSADFSRYFIITPYTGGFKENTIYSLYIYRSAHVYDQPELLIEFDSLVELPASTLSPANPEYAEYTFRTGSSSDTDTRPPVILTTNPGNNEKDVDPGLSPGGYIELVFLDNVVPMIYPPTVNSGTISLENVTDPADTSNPYNFHVELDANDTDFKTFHLYPLASLKNGNNYKLTISVDDQIEDFQGNSLNETSIFFDTAP